METFKFKLEEAVIYKAMPYTIIGRAQFVIMSENRYLLQRWDEKIGYDFAAGVWVTESEITLK